MKKSCVWLVALFITTQVDTRHFNGGTIRWVPLDPYDNASNITITVLQSYSWSMPLVRCANDVPISSPSWTAANGSLKCVADCSTDGGYSTTSVSILTDCISASPSMGIMSSERAVNITLAGNAHFYASYTGAAWRSLSSPAISGLDWSMLFSVDLGRRPDGSINTPPEARIVSPQYVIVNQTTKINIRVSDVNVGDDVRCRWSTYTNGYRRRRRSGSTLIDIPGGNFKEQEYSKTLRNFENIRKKRLTLSCSDIDCQLQCQKECPCTCPICQGTTCTGGQCNTVVCFSTTSTTTITPASTSIESDAGTPRSTSIFPVRQAIDECGGICYPSTVPPGTTLSNCTISFTGLIPGAWYAIAIQVWNLHYIPQKLYLVQLQVEDFINNTSDLPMSSVPVQFLVHVLPSPSCPERPVILLDENCFEASIGIQKSFNVSVVNLCDPEAVQVVDLMVSQTITGLEASNFTTSSIDPSTSYRNFAWTPQANQLGAQSFCVIAYTR